MDIDTGTLDYAIHRLETLHSYVSRRLNCGGDEAFEGMDRNLGEIMETLIEVRDQIVESEGGAVANAQN